MKRKLLYLATAGLIAITSSSVFAKNYSNRPTRPVRPTYSTQEVEMKEERPERKGIEYRVGQEERQTRQRGNQEGMQRGYARRAETDKSESSRTEKGQNREMHRQHRYGSRGIDREEKGQRYMHRRGMRQENSPKKESPRTHYFRMERSGNREKSYGQHRMQARHGSQKQEGKESSECSHKYSQMRGHMERRSQEGPRKGSPMQHRASPRREMKSERMMKQGPRMMQRSGMGMRQESEKSRPMQHRASPERRMRQERSVEKKEVGQRQERAGKGMQGMRMMRGQGPMQRGSR